MANHKLRHLPDIKPCPFCGGEIVERAHQAAIYGAPFMRCLHCGLDGPKVCYYENKRKIENHTIQVIGKGNPVTEHKYAALSLWNHRENDPLTENKNLKREVEQLRNLVGILIKRANP
jgi:hypothetical protein